MKSFLLALLILLLVVIGITPTLISTQKGQEITKKWINQRIPGKVEISSFKVGWLTGQKVGAFRLLDKEGRVIASFDSFETEAKGLSLLLRRYSLGKTNLKNLNVNYLIDKSGVSNVDKALSSKAPRKQKAEREWKLPKVRGDIHVENAKIVYQEGVTLPVTLSDLNIDTQEDEKTVHVVGKIEQAGTVGNILVNGHFGKEFHILADIEDFPMSLADSIGNTTLFTKAIGPSLNIHVALDRKEKVITASLKVDATHIQGELKGHTENGKFVLDNPGQIVFNVTPQLFQEFVESSAWTLGSKSSLTLKIEEFTYPLKLKKFDFSKVPIVGSVTVERSEISNETLGTFSLNDFLVHFSSKDDLIFTYSGTIQSNEGPTDLKGAATLNEEKKWTFSGDIKGFPLPLLELVSKQMADLPPLFGKVVDVTYSGVFFKEELTLDFSLLSQLFCFNGTLSTDTLKGAGEIFVPKYRQELIGSNPLFELHSNFVFENHHLYLPFVKFTAQNEHLNLVLQGEAGEKGKAFTPDSLKVKGGGTFKNIPALYVFEEGSFEIELNGKKNEGELKVALFSTQEKVSHFQSDVTIKNYIQEGAFNFPKAFYAFDGKASNFPLCFLNEFFKKEYPLNELLGSHIDFDFEGDFACTKERTEKCSHLDLKIEGEGIEAEIAFAKDKTVELALDRPSFVKWTLTKERYLALLHLFALDETPTYMLLKPAQIELYLKDFICPAVTKIPLSTFFSECGIVGNFLSEELVFVNEENSKLSIQNLSGIVHGEDLAKRLFIEVRGGIEAAKIPKMQNSGFTFVGEVQDLLTPAGRFDRTRLKVKGDLALDFIPIQPLLGLLPLNEERRVRLHAILGDLMNARVYGEIQELSGPLTIDVKASNFKTLLPFNLEKGVAKLREDVVAELTLTPEVSENFFQDINPMIIRGAWSQHPVKLYIDAKGFSLPLHRFSLEGMHIERAVIDLGRIQVRNGGSIQSLMAFVKAKEITPDGVMNVWFTPIYLKLSNAVVSYKRFDMLLAENVHIALWGAIDLRHDRVNMVLGIAPSTLQKKLNIKGLEDKQMFQVRMTGPTKHVEMDWSAAYTRIGILIARSSGGIGSLLGGIVESIVTSLGDEETPPPTTYPFPWD